MEKLALNTSDDYYNHSKFQVLCCTGSDFWDNFFSVFLKSGKVDDVQSTKQIVLFQDHP